MIEGRTDQELRREGGRKERGKGKNNMKGGEISTKRKGRREVQQNIEEEEKKKKREEGSNR